MTGLRRVFSAHERICLKESASKSASNLHRICFKLASFLHFSIADPNVDCILTGRDTKSERIPSRERILCHALKRSAQRREAASPTSVGVRVLSERELSRRELSERELTERGLLQRELTERAVRAGVPQEWHGSTEGTASALPHSTIECAPSAA